MGIEKAIGKGKGGYGEEGDVEGLEILARCIMNSVWVGFGIFGVLYGLAT